MWRAKGINGTIEFDGRAVTIRREGLLARGTFGTGTTTIALANIASVQWRSAGLTAGQISLVLIGGGAATVIRMGGRGAKGAVTDPHTVAFHRHKQREFEAVRNAIQQALSGGPSARAPEVQPVPTKPPPQPEPVRQSPPPGWYADPQGQPVQRWWDGVAWTEHIQV